MSGPTSRAPARSDAAKTFTDASIKGQQSVLESIAKADALLFGRVTYEMMEAAWRPPGRTGARPDWMEPFARTIDAEGAWASIAASIKSLKS